MLAALRVLTLALLGLLPDVDEEPGRLTEVEERLILRRINEDRGREGLPPLRFDDRLARIARAHSEEMRDTQHLGHVSPRSGKPIDRVRAGGLRPAVVLENVAQAYSVEETHAALMRSPGHRRAILSAAVDQVGIGVRVARLEDGQRELWVTEVFYREAQPFDVARTPAEALARVRGLREETGWRPLRADRRLLTVAQQMAQRWSATGSRAAAGEVLRRNLPELGVYPEIYVLHIAAADPKHLDDIAALRDPAMSHFGLGVAPAPAGVESSAYLVLLLGQRSMTPGLRAGFDPFDDRMAMEE